MRRSLFALSLAALLASPAAAQYPAGATGQSNLALVGVTAPATDSSNRIATTAWANSWVASALPLLNGRIWVGSAGNIATPQTPSGDLTMSNVGAFTFNTVNGNVGAFGSATQCATVTVNAKGLTTAASATTCTPAIGSVTGLAANIATWLGTPSSANLRAAVTDETGTGLLYFQGGDIGTPSAGVGTNLTALNATQLTSGTVPWARLPAPNFLSGAPTCCTGTTSTTPVMMGAGVTTCRFAPTFSSRAEFIITGSVGNTTATQASILTLRYGTGAGPTNGVAATGTQIGAQMSVTSSTANALGLFHVGGPVGGLTPGTTYWFDVTLAATANTSAISSVTCNATEF